MIIAVCVVAGLDPVAQVFAWAAGVATLGVLVLLVLTCVAVIVFFARSGLDRRAWHTRIAPALGFLGLAACLVLTIVNFPTLIGGSTALALGLGGLLALVTAVGIVMALARRERAPVGPGAGEGLTAPSAATPPPPRPSDRLSTTWQEIAP